MIVDDTRLVRKSLAVLLTAEGVEIVGEGAHGGEVLPLFRRHRPSLLFVDVFMPVMDGPEAVEAVLREEPGALVVFCSSSQGPEVSEQLLRGGPRFLHKPYTAGAVRAVLAPRASTR